MKIIHLSDLHIGHWGLERKFKKIAHNIIERENPDQNIIIITGDIVESGFSKSEFNKALNLINQLKNAGFKVLLIPGNHDYGTGLVNKQKIAKRFSETFLPEIKEFPIVDIINDSIFIGLDSNAGELHWYDRFFADGEIGDVQLKKIEEIITMPEHKNKIKIVYLHHHPVSHIPFHNLKDANKLKSIIENKVNILLYGHNHIGKTNHGAWGIKIMMDAGSSTGKRTFLQPIRHRVIDLSNLSIQEKNYLI